IGWLRVRALSRFLTKDRVERDVVVGWMGRLAWCRLGNVERSRKRALVYRTGWGRAASRPDPLEEGLRRNARFLSAARSQLFDFALQSRVVGSLREQRLIDTQRVLWMALFEIQLGHRFREYG